MYWSGARTGSVHTATRRRRTRPDRNPGAIACFAGASTGTLPGTAGCLTGSTATLATGTTTTASASFCPFSFSAGHPVLPTKLKRQSEAGRPAELQWSKAAQPRPAAGPKHSMDYFPLLSMRHEIPINNGNNGLTLYVCIIS